MTQTMAYRLKDFVEIVALGNTEYKELETMANELLFELDNVKIGGTD